MVSSGNYNDARKVLKNASSITTDKPMKLAVDKIIDQQAEKISATAVEHFQQINWMRAKELFNYAYLTCSEGYTNEKEFQNLRGIAEKMRLINASNETTMLTRLMSLTQNSTVRNVISARLEAAKKANPNAAEAEKYENYFF